MNWSPWMTLHLIGLTVRLDGERLMVSPADDLTDDVREFIIHNRTPIVEVAQMIEKAALEIGAHNAESKARAVANHKANLR